MASVVDFRSLLGRTSRTFDLSIPLLPEPHRCHLTLAYLLFRVADTLEDAEGKPRGERLNALAQLKATLEARDLLAAEEAAVAWCRWRPSQHSGYMELLESFPALLEAILTLRPSARRIVLRHTCRTVDGMARFVEQSRDDGSLQLESIESLRQYCYAVAGIVGEMITELFVDGCRRLACVAPELRRHASAFGEALQLVNILKDARDDAQWGRRYLPHSVARDQIFELARSDLRQADRWVVALQSAQADPGMIAFGKLPAMLARATLDLVEREGAGSKLTRSQVARIVSAVDPDFRLLGGVPKSFAERCAV